MATTEAEASGPMDSYREICADLASKSANAARRNKPTMWAYYIEMREGLLAWFSDVTPSDSGYAGAALALSQKAERECPGLPATEAARLWALGVYARRILRSWFDADDGGPGYRVSLRWLHNRQGEAWNRAIAEITDGAA